MPTREAIVGKLAKERARLLERYAAFSPEQLEAAATKSEDPDGAPWRAKDHLAHIAMIERAFQGMIRRHLAGEPRPVGLGGGSRADVLASVHRNNQRNVDEHRADAMDELLAGLDAARRDTLALLDELTDEQLDVVVPGAPWGGGTIGGILITNGYHDAQHLQWVQEGLGSA